MAAKKKPAGKAAKKIEWTRNRTGKQPVGDCVWVEVRQRDGNVFTDMAGNIGWNRVGLGSVGDHCDIMAWRRVRKPRADKGTKVAGPVHKGRDELVALPMAGDGDQLDMTATSSHERPAAEPVRVCRRDCTTCRHMLVSSFDEPCLTCCNRVREPNGPQFSLWESPTEPVRHFDRSDELLRGACHDVKVYTDVPLQAGVVLDKPIEYGPGPWPRREVEPHVRAIAAGLGVPAERVAFELTALHPLANDLDPTTPARPAGIEDDDHDRHGNALIAATWVVLVFAALGTAAYLLARHWEPLQGWFA